MIDERFVILGVFIFFLGSIGYFKETILGKVKPNKVTWFLWSLAPLIAFFAQIKQGVGIQSLLTFIVAFIPLIIFLASFPTVIKSYKEPETENYVIYFTNAIAALVTLLTIKVWSFEQFAFPLYIFLITLLIAVLLKFKIGMLFAKK